MDSKLTIEQKMEMQQQRQQQATYTNNISSVASIAHSHRS
jgi:hypothetical protein